MNLRPLTSDARSRSFDARRKAWRGAALLEVAVAVPIVLVALGMFVQMFLMGSGLRGSGRDSWAASGAAQTLLEEMRNEDFGDICRLYNADPFDDPAGPGTSPGNRFAVPGLPPLEGMVGEIVLPITNSGTEVVPVWELREDVEQAALGMPRDLNGDILVDALDHSEDYTLLPVELRLRWRGVHGPREFSLYTVFAELR